MQYCILPVKHLLCYIRLLLSCFSPKAGITTINFLVFSNIYRTPTSMLVFLFCVSVFSNSSRSRQMVSCAEPGSAGGVFLSMESFSLAMCNMLQVTAQCAVTCSTLRCKHNLLGFLIKKFNQLNNKGSSTVLLDN